MSCYKSKRILKQVGLSQLEIDIFIREEIDYIALQYMKPEHYTELGFDPMLYWDIKSCKNTLTPFIGG